MVSGIVNDTSKGDALHQVVGELMVVEMVKSLEVLKLHVERTCQCKITPSCLPCAIRILVFGGKMNRKEEDKSSIIMPGNNIKRPATISPHIRRIK